MHVLYQLGHSTGNEVVGVGPLHCEVVGPGVLRGIVVVGVGPLHCEVVGGGVLRGAEVVCLGGTLVVGGGVLGLGTVDPGGGRVPVPP
ncbi:hypothetical protein MSAS_03320 [Mycobacterium saskatchewanense]|uniref:Uncharacterized protein n=1 Tax=Mycobacterium saskatchewanense TaxID=220927 RepID=A0AAJ3TX33_9MYCO|nr:hypothetical protein [Mycobacterium saskatchewanense]ORW75166.1 hypothetical protein AWC23_03035 [Mycobacterium saskatchewanense]BBX61158.1 hypothetical protein MSAS_03320 [Mycobacterium saskatchewanense]